MVSVTMALRGLSSNKLRSALTMLGVIIGVAAVIVAVGIAQGSRQAVAELIQKLGTNVLTVFPGQQRTGAVGMGQGSSNTMTLADADAILRECADVVKVSPQVNQRAQVKSGDKNTSTTINGTGADYPDISNSPVEQGKYFDLSDIKSLRRVAILGSQTATDLFDQQNPVGKNIRVKGISFQVVGVLKSKGGMGFRNPDDAVYVPVTTAMRRLFGMENIQTITCQARADGVMDRAQDQITQTLLKRHNILNEANADFRIFSQADIASTQNEQQDVFSFLIGGMAFISLLVGGIGIMNIMLVSVTERTREIGVRKAIGAKRRNVLTQFLLEAVFLSVTGGLIGVTLGISGASIFGELMQWQVAVDPSAVTMAFGSSAAVGIFFGFYPALKASNLNPIDALRYE